MKTILMIVIIAIEFAYIGSLIGTAIINDRITKHLFDKGKQNDEGGKID